jgi:hypothetical protein
VTCVPVTKLRGGAGGACRRLLVRGLGEVLAAMSGGGGGGVEEAAVHAAHLLFGPLLAELGAALAVVPGEAQVC